MRKAVVMVLIVAAIGVFAEPASAAAPKWEVDAACDRTAGCWREACGKGECGCSPNVCFFCDGEVCHANSKAPGGKKPIGSGGRA